MLTRRAIVALPLGLAVPAAAGVPFQSFVAGVYREALGEGVRRSVLDAAFAGVAPNQKVIDLDRRQVEFTMTWAQYRARVVSEQKIAQGRAAVAQNRALLARIENAFHVSAAVVAGIWGAESSFGAITGDYRVVEALATLAWEGRRAAFFRGELMAALKILNAGDIPPERMLGSYAGAMGQPQFMPSSYLKLAVDFDGDGRRDIWTSKADVLASIANYLARNGWRPGETWGQAVRVPAGFAAQGREVRRTVEDWGRAGVVPANGRWAAAQDMPAAVIALDGPGGETFAVFNNFQAIRRYNPSDFYAAAVGLIGDLVMT